MTPPRWLFFPTQSSAPQYIYTAQTDNIISRGVVQANRREQDSTGTESGSLVDQFSPRTAGTDQYRRNSSDQISFRVINNDTSDPLYGTKALLAANITSATFTVGSNTFTPESITIGGTNSNPIFQLNTSGDAAQTFWLANNLHDTDDITITVTLTF